MSGGPRRRCPQPDTGLRGASISPLAPGDARRVPYYSQDQICVRADAEQDHNRSLVRTETRVARCTGGINTNAPGDIRHRAEWYADGRFCVYIPEQRSPTTSYQFTSYVNEDVWYKGCNNGPGVNVYISMDTWNWAWSFRENRWVADYGGNPGTRPITGHCHCP